MLGRQAEKDVKRCQDCNLDVTDLPRVKDKQGRYRCRECELAKIRQAAGEKNKNVMIPTAAGDGMFELQPEIEPVDKRPRATPVGSETLPPGETPKCRHCGYELRGLREPKCPECGKLVSLTRHERGEMDAAWRRKWSYQKPAMIFGVCAAIMTIAGAAMADPGTSGKLLGDYWLRFGIVLAAVCITSLVLFFFTISLESTPVLMVLRWAAAIAAADVSRLVMLLFAQYVFGPAVLFWPFFYFGAIIGVLWDLTDAELTDVIIASFVCTGVSIALFAFM